MKSNQAKGYECFNIIVTKGINCLLIKRSARPIEPPTTKASRIQDVSTGQAYNLAAGVAF